MRDLLAQEQAVRIINMLRTNIYLWSAELALKSVIRICIYAVIAIILILIIIALIKACFKKKKKPITSTNPNQNIKDTATEKKIDIETELLVLKNNLSERR